MVKKDSSENIKTAALSSEAPPKLRVAIEKIMLEATEELDPLFALMLTNLTINITDAAYSMGKRDGHLLINSEK
jgi:hypothetical protein